MLSLLGGLLNSNKEIGVFIRLLLYLSSLISKILINSLLLKSLNYFN